MNTCLSGLTGNMTKAVTRMDQCKDFVYRPQDIIGLGGDLQIFKNFTNVMVTICVFAIHCKDDIETCQ